MINIHSLIEVSEFVKIKVLCEKTGLNYNTIKTKTSRKSELTKEESEILTDALDKVQKNIKKSMNT